MIEQGLICGLFWQGVSGSRHIDLIRCQVQHHGGFQQPTMQATTQFVCIEGAFQRGQGGISGLDNLEGVALA